MQTLPLTLRCFSQHVLNMSCLICRTTLTLSIRAISSSSDYDYEDQSRGGLPRFFSQLLPPSKANLFPPSFIFSSSYFFHFSSGFMTLFYLLLKLPFFIYFWLWIQFLWFIELVLQSEVCLIDYDVMIYLFLLFNNAGWYCACTGWWILAHG